MTARVLREGVGGRGEPTLVGVLPPDRVGRRARSSARCCRSHRGERRRTALADRLRADLAAAYRAREYSGELAGITAAFRSLPAADQELLALAAWEGLTTGQIAAVLGCSPNAVRIRRHRARRRFTALLASDQAARSIDGHLTNGDLA